MVLRFAVDEGEQASFLPAAELRADWCEIDPLEIPRERDEAVDELTL